MLCHDSPWTKQRRSSLILSGRNNGFCSQIYMHIGQSSARVLELALGLWWSGLVYLYVPSSIPMRWYHHPHPQYFSPELHLVIHAMEVHCSTCWRQESWLNILPVRWNHLLIFHVTNSKVAALGNGIQNPEKILQCTHQFLQVWHYPSRILVRLSVVLWTFLASKRLLFCQNWILPWWCCNQPLQFQI